LEKRKTCDFYITYLYSGAVLMVLLHWVKKYHKEKTQELR